MPRQTTRQPRKATPTRPAPVPFTFICTACGAVEHTRTPALPKGWATEQIREDIFAYCPDDAIDLPRRSSMQ